MRSGRELPVKRGQQSRLQTAGKEKPTCTLSSSSQKKILLMLPKESIHDGYAQQP
jgi:hypothetical protein